MRVSTIGLPHPPGKWKRGASTGGIATLEPPASFRGSFGDGSRSVAKLRPALGEESLEAVDDAGMHLANAAFAEIERGADLLHRHLLVVVEDDDEPLVAVEAARDQAHEVAVL